VPTRVPMVSVTERSLPEPECSAGASSSLAVLGAAARLIIVLRLPGHPASRYYRQLIAINAGRLESSEIMQLGQQHCRGQGVDPAETSQPAHALTRRVRVGNLGKRRNSSIRRASR
jgi:hypothetical protein